VIAWRLALLALVAATPVAAQAVPEPPDYRGEPYRAPVPATLAGAQVIDAEQALELHRQGHAAFVDVLPRPSRRPDGLPEGTVWNEPPHLSIPGALWLWDTGYERLSPAEEARLRDGLTRAKAGDANRPVVIFCQADCWMSWNAARRAVEWGFDPVLWFPGGTDDWSFADGPLVNAVPVDP